MERRAGGGTVVVRMDIIEVVYGFLGDIGEEYSDECIVKR